MKKGQRDENDKSSNLEMVAQKGQSKQLDFAMQMANKGV